VWDNFSYLSDARGMSSSAKVTLFFPLDNGQVIGDGGPGGTEMEVMVRRR